MNKRDIIARLETYTNVITWVLIGLTVVAGGIYALILGDRLRYIDEQDYFALAENLIRYGAFTSDGIQAAAFRPPGYPFLLALFRLVGAPIFALRMLNFLALAGMILLLQRLTLRLFHSRSASVVAAALPLCYPVLFYTAGALYPQIIGAFLLVLVIYIVAQPTLGLAQLLLAGSAMSWLILMIPAMGFLVPVLALWRLTHNRLQRWHEPIIFVLAGLLLPFAWSIRNRIAFGEFVFVSANSGFNLFLGNSASATPNSGANTPRGDLETQTAGLNDVERDQVFRDAALRWVQDNPTQALALFGQKVLNHFNYRNELVNRAEASPANDIIMFVTFYPLLALATIRLLLFRRWPVSAVEWWIALIYVLGAVTTAVFFTRIRFRLPFDVLLFIMVSGLISTLQKKHEHKNAHA